MNDIRYDVSIGAARDIERALAGLTLTPQQLSKIAYTVLEAIYAAESRLDEYACAFLCPRCFRPYRINVALRGRTVRCVVCGYAWRSPERAERN